MLKNQPARVTDPYEKYNYIISELVQQLGLDDNYYALELLEHIREFLKRNMSDNMKMLHFAFVMLLTQDRDVFKTMRNDVLEGVFVTFPFTELQVFVDIAQTVREIMSEAATNLLLQRRRKTTGKNAIISTKCKSLTTFKRERIKEHFRHRMVRVKATAQAQAQPILPPPAALKPDVSEPPPSTSSAPSSSWLGVKPVGSGNVLKNCFMKYKHCIPDLNWEDFHLPILDILHSGQTDDAIQNDLLEILGFDSFELIYALLSERTKILAQNPSKKHSKSKHKSHKFESSNRKEKQRDKPVVPPSVAHAQQAQDAQQQAEQFQSLSSAFALSSQPYKHVHDQYLEIRSKLITCGNISNLPFNAIVKKTNMYEEISIPPDEASAIKAGKIVDIKELDAIGRIVFKDITKFNLIQSEVFDTAYHTNENMLICAPTGAGKTNIALMTIVHEIKKHMKDNRILVHAFKIVYVCPMKALAAEMVRNFSRKLTCLGIKVKELTGDMQMTRKEIMETQMLITTPEKWDVISRKGTADAELTTLLKLLIIDEVHLLNSDRGPVIEALVARTLRQILSTQNMIRIVGLSATLPSYVSVGQFLRVNMDEGLFFFDSRYRSVPLQQTFVGVKTSGGRQTAREMDEVCFIKLMEFLREGHQAMVFVHARNETTRTAKFIKETASKQQLSNVFRARENDARRSTLRNANFAHKDLKELLEFGIGVHHAGMIRPDRNAVERYFADGVIKVVVCTATLAWGINLPAHAVIIKGTEIHNAKRGCFTDLDVLDVLQIFGRAGRPQFDTSGHGVIITSHEKTQYYLSALTNQVPIESQFLSKLADNLNAEIVLGTVRSAQEGVEWLTYTYLYRRMQANPLVYGMLQETQQEDPELREHLLQLVHNAATQLDEAKMVRYDVRSGELASTYLGRTASYFYINLETILIFSERLTKLTTDTDVLNTMSLASEFRDMQVRKEDLPDLDELAQNYCEYPVLSVENTEGKVCLLMQCYLSRAFIKSMSLVSDMVFINQSAGRIARALFDMALHEHCAALASRCLAVAQAFDIQMWPHQTPLRQFPDISAIILELIESAHIDLYALKDMTASDIGKLIHNTRAGAHIKQCVDAFPELAIDAVVLPITRAVLRIRLSVTPIFTWLDKFHGKSVQPFWVWVEDPESDTIYYSESFVIAKGQCMRRETIELVFTIPLVEEHGTQYFIRLSSDQWLGAVQVHPLLFKDLTIPETFTAHTDLLELQPLPVTALGNQRYQSLYNFTHFNPVQTQIFHCLYHTDNNVLLGAPTGSGKTIAAELCVLHLLNRSPNLKAVYVAPLKALVRERMDDWSRKFAPLKLKVIEVTGDVTANVNDLKTANIIVTTPEKWDGMTRGWQNRQYVRKVGLLIIDEIHLLGEERGPVLEVIISRLNFICNQMGMKPRVVGLSAAIANAGDLAHWLGIRGMGLYNFRPSVRPVPIETHIKGFQGKHYCPRMISMNRPTYQAIRRFSPDKPTLVFCSSRKQTRLTAFDLMTYLLTDADPKQWLHCDEDVIDYVVASVTNPDLKNFLPFGIGIHHAGLLEKDRAAVEELFLNAKIQVLIATSTLAWGVNFPAHLVVIKGTEYYDGRVKRYIDMPISDVLQMMGRAGRPQFDTEGIACVFVEEVKLPFYKQFLYEPFPIESHLHDVLPDHINAEIASETIVTKEKLLIYLTSTYLFRRLGTNPSYYGIRSCNRLDEALNVYLNQLADAAIRTLVEAECVRVIIDERDNSLTYEGTFFGHVASYYYMSHKSMILFREELRLDSSINDILRIISRTEEYALFPVRHNEDKTNKELSQQMRYEVADYESPHCKVALLIHAYLSKFDLPNQEYVVDLKTVMDQISRILQAIVDIVTNNGWLGCTIKVIHVMQMLTQGQLLDQSAILTVPHVTAANHGQLLAALTQVFHPDRQTRPSLIDLKVAVDEQRRTVDLVLNDLFIRSEANEIVKFLARLPAITFELTVAQEGAQSYKYRPDATVPMRITADTDYVMRFRFERRGPNILRVGGGRYTKPKNEGWYIIVGQPSTNAMMKIKRLSFRKTVKFDVRLIAPKTPGTHAYCVYIFSDCYLGLDQQFEIPIEVV